MVEVAAPTRLSSESNQPWKSNLKSSMKSSAAGSPVKDSSSATRASTAPRPAPAGRRCGGSTASPAMKKMATELIGLIVEQGRAKLLRKDGRVRITGKVDRLHLAAAQDILDRLHGKPTQPTEQVPTVDVSTLSDEELSTLDSLRSRVLGPNGTNNSASGAQKP